MAGATPGAAQVQRQRPSPDQVAGPRERSRLHRTTHHLRVLCSVAFKLPVAAPTPAGRRRRLGCGVAAGLPGRAGQTPWGSTTRPAGPTLTRTGTCHDSERQSALALRQCRQRRSRGLGARAHDGRRAGLMPALPLPCSTGPRRAGATDGALLKPPDRARQSRFQPSRLRVGPKGCRVSRCGPFHVNPCGYSVGPGQCSRKPGARAGPVRRAGPAGVAGGRRSNTGGPWGGGRGGAGCRKV